MKFSATVAKGMESTFTGRNHRVDAEDFVTSTHEMRKAYAVMKQQEVKSLPMKFRIAAIRGSFEIFWSALTREDPPIEGTPEWDAFKDATSRTAAEYIQFYGVDSVIELESSNAAQDRFSTPRRVVPWRVFPSPGRSDQ